MESESRASFEGFADTGMRCKRNQDNQRKYSAGSCSYAAFMPDEHVPESDHAIFEGAILASFAGRVFGAKEKILGSAYVGKRIF